MNDKKCSQKLKAFDEIDSLSSIVIKWKEIYENIKEREESNYEKFMKMKYILSRK